MFYINLFILQTYDYNFYFEVTVIFLCAGIRSVLGIGHYRTLSIGIGIGKEKNGMGTSVEVKHLLIYIQTQEAQ